MDGRSPFRRLAVERGERNISLKEQALSLSSAGALSERTEETDRQFASETSRRNGWITRPGDLVVNPMWLFGGAIGVSTRNGAVSPDYRVYRLGSALHPRFIHHLVRSTPYREQYRLYMRAETTFDRRITKDDFHDLPLIVPPLAEQRAIADYLDAETARIDRGGSPRSLSLPPRRDRPARDPRGRRVKPDERGFEDAITGSLVEAGGYRVCKWGTKPEWAGDFNPKLGLDTAELLAFIEETQPTAWKRLLEVHGGPDGVLQPVRRSPRQAARRARHGRCPAPRRQRPRDRGPPRVLQARPRPDARADRALPRQPPDRHPPAPVRRRPRPRPSTSACSSTASRSRRPS